MAKKTFAIIFLIPLTMFFVFNGARLPLKAQPIYEAGNEYHVENQKIYYLLPENDLNVSVNEEFDPYRNNRNSRKPKPRDPHLITHRNFHR